MREIVDYWILREATIIELQTKVDEVISAGWEPAGGWTYDPNPILNHYPYTQTLARYEETKDEDKFSQTEGT